VLAGTHPQQATARPQHVFHVAFSAIGLLALRHPNASAASFRAAFEPPVDCAKTTQVRDFEPQVLVDISCDGCQDAAVPSVVRNSTDTRFPATQRWFRLMAQFEASDSLTREELAWELAELFEELDIEDINEVLAKNVPLDTLEFFSAYADDFGSTIGLVGKSRKRLPNLMLLGYLLRVLEDRLLPDEEPPFDA
jgi:hypothetical protein